MLVMGLLLSCAFGGLAIDRSITAAVMGDTWTQTSSGKIPRTWGVGFARYGIDSSKPKTPNAVAIIATAL